MRAIANFGLALIAGSGIFAAGALADEQRLTATEIAERVERAESDSFANLESYSVVRRYVIKQARLGKGAEMTLKVKFTPTEGKTFEILSSQNAEGMQKKVFDKILEAEKESSQPKSLDQIRLTNRNYAFEYLGTERRNGTPCYILGIKPKRKHKMLLEGKAWVNQDDFGIVHIEGKPTERASFWVGKAEITQSFTKVGPFWIMCSNRSVADVRLLGQAELNIQSSGFEVKVRENQLARTAKVFVRQEADAASSLR